MPMHFMFVPKEGVNLTKGSSYVITVEDDGVARIWSGGTALELSDDVSPSGLSGLMDLLGGSANGQSLLNSIPVIGPMLDKLKSLLGLITSMDLSTMSKKDATSLKDMATSLQVDGVKVEAALSPVINYVQTSRKALASKHDREAKDPK